MHRTTSRTGGVLPRRRGTANPLLRPSDRIERIARAVGLIVFVLTVPLSVWFGARSYTAGLQTMHEETASRVAVTATVINGTAAVAVIAPGGASTAVQYTSARWQAPDGTQRSGYVRVPDGTLAGATIPIWTDPSGRLVDPPLSRLNLIKSATGVGVAASSISAISVLLSLALLHLRLDRARMRAWEAEWAAVEPAWSGRLR